VFNIRTSHYYNSFSYNIGCLKLIYVTLLLIGHKEVWHGSVDILVGPVAVTVTKSSIDEENSELEGKGDSAFDLEICKLEELRHQLIPESILYFHLQCIVDLFL
jgi:hypothetical protein